jgi:thiamine-phosphate pyrophosphorylase
VIDLGLVAIASPPFVDAASVMGACRAAERGGATAVQVRFKNCPASVLLDVTERLVAALSIPVYVNDRADVALAASATGVHIGTEDIPPALVRGFAANPFRLGVSVGTTDEAGAALEVDVDYWSIGSIYATASKSDAGAPIGIAGFKELARLAPAGMPVIAIGGIDASNARPVLEAGAHGVAVIRAVFGATDVERSTRKLRDIVDEVRRG